MYEFLRVGLPGPLFSRDSRSTPFKVTSRRTIKIMNSALKSYKGVISSERRKPALQSTSRKKSQPSRPNCLTNIPFPSWVSMPFARVGAMPQPAPSKNKNEKRKASSFQSSSKPKGITIEVSHYRPIRVWFRLSTGSDFVWAFLP